MWTRRLLETEQVVARDAVFFGTRDAGCEGKHRAHDADVVHAACLSRARIEPTLWRKQKGGRTVFGPPSNSDDEPPSRDGVLQCVYVCVRVCACALLGTAVVRFRVAVGYLFTISVRQIYRVPVLNDAHRDRFRSLELHR